MGVTKTAWQKGKSGNPAGRPPNERALAACLRMALDERIKVDGHWMSRLEYQSLMIAELATEGQTKLYDSQRQTRGDLYTIGPKDWIVLTKDIASHIDGPVRADIDISITHVKAYIGFSPDDWDEQPPQLVDVTPKQLPEQTTQQSEPIARQTRKRPAVKKRTKSKKI